MEDLPFNIPENLFDGVKKAQIAGVKLEYAKWVFEMHHTYNIPIKKILKQVDEILIELDKKAGK